MALASTDYEQAGELKIGQVGIANLRILTLNVPQLIQEMRDRVARAPKLFGRAALIIDFGGLPHPPDPDTARTLLDGIRDAGVLPVALAYGTRETERLAEQLGLPVLAKFRAQYERIDTPSTTPAPAKTSPASTVSVPPEKAPADTAKKKHSTDSGNISKPGYIQKGSVRSGQQVYAQNSDLTVLSTVGAGAEVIADGSIHVYGGLRGRALAGAQGDTEARIFCLNFLAELVAIAGHYKVLDDIPDTLRGKPVQVWLEQDQIKLAPME
ncbi:MAG: septum site-determining protein MinC [Xanthomonadaceae bacterium]|nr:septum site-determining protein MinC [Xanthomonadaceae bacterium]